MPSDLWGEASRVRVSGRWTSLVGGWHGPLTRALIAAAAIEPHSIVLDLACGSGEPALDILRDFPSVTVVGIDRSFPGLKLARETGLQGGVDSRVAFSQADVHALPVATDSVDRITCRFGVMFFEDAERAAAEMRRVLKSGGRLALIAWGPFDQPFFASTMGVVLRRVPGAVLPAEGRKMCRFAAPGSLGEPLRRAGFLEVEERHTTVPRIWKGAPEQLWAYQQDVGACFRPLFESIPEHLRSEIDAEVIQNLERFRGGDALVVPTEVVLVTASN